MPRHRNPDGANWIDLGLGGFLAGMEEYADHAADNYGKKKVPTLRNVDKCPYPAFVKVYTHNGFFKNAIRKSKRQVMVHEQRDSKCWHHEDRVR